MPKTIARSLLTLTILVWVGMPQVVVAADDPPKATESAVGSATLEELQAYLIREQARIVEQVKVVRNQEQRRRSELAVLSVEGEALRAERARAQAEQAAGRARGESAGRSQPQVGQLYSYSRSATDADSRSSGNSSAHRSFAAPDQSIYYGNRCSTAVGISDPGPFQRIGSPCSANGLQGVVVDVFDLMRRLGVEAGQLDSQAVRLDRLSVDVFELLKKLGTSPRPTQNLSDIRIQIRELAKALSLDWEPS